MFIDSLGGMAAGLEMNASAATKDAVARIQHRGCRLLRRLNWLINDEAAVAKVIIVQLCCSAVAVRAVEAKAAIDRCFRM